MITDSISLKDILDSSLDYIYVYDLKGRIIYQNKCAGDLSGYPPDQVKGFDLYEIDTIFKTPDYYKKEIERTLKKGDCIRGEMVVYLGERNRFLEYYLSPVYNDDGEIKAAVSSLREITRQRSVEEDLRAEKNLNAAFLDTANVFIGVFSPSGKPVLLNRRAEDILGYNLKEFDKGNFIDFCVPEGLRNTVRHVFSRVIRGEGGEFNENPVITRSGEIRMIRWHNSVLRDVNGFVTYIISSGEDITDLTEARKEAEENATRYETLFNSMGTSIAVLDNDTSILIVNDEFLRMSGYSLDKLIGRKWTEFVSPEEISRMMEYHHLRRISPEKVPHGYFFRFLASDGKVKRIWLTGSIIEGTDQSVVSLLDLTENEKIREAAQRIQNQFEAMVKNADVFIILYDSEGKLLFWNPKTMAEMNFEDLDELNSDPARIVELFPSRKEYIYHSEAALRVFKEGHPVSVWESVLVNSRGEEIRVSYTASSFYDCVEKRYIAIAVGTDVTEREIAAVELKRSEKEKRIILESMTDLLVFQSPDHEIIYLNKAAGETLNVTQDSIRGRKCHELWAESDTPCPRCPVEKSLETDQVEQGQITTPDGRVWNIHAYPVRDDNGVINGIVEIGTNITKEIELRKDLEIKQKESFEAERKYKTLFDTAGFAFCLIRNDGVITLVNLKFEEITGFTAQQVQGKINFARFFERQTVNKIRRHLKPDEEGRINPFEYECEAKVAKNKKIYIHAMIVPFDKGQSFIVSFNDMTLLKRSRISLLSSLRKVKRLNKGIVQVISSVTELRDPYTAGHQDKVAKLSASIAREMGISARERDILYTAAALHDVGKLSIPSEILNKPGKLTELEFSIIRMHPQTGHDILENVEFQGEIADIVLQHHERLDGSGYPRGLSGKEILLDARIIAVADVVEAMTSHRPYRPALGRVRALDEITKNAGILYDSEVVKACQTVFEQGFVFSDPVK